MTRRHTTRCARAARRALILMLATMTAAVLPPALGSPGTYAATAAASAHATRGSTQHGIRSGAVERKLPQVPCGTVGVILADAGCGFQTTTGRVGYSIHGVDAWYSVSYVAPGAQSWSVCVEGRRRGIFDIEGACAVPIGSMVQADTFGVVGVIGLREEH